MGRTISEKILSRSTGQPVAAGDIVYPEPDLVTVHDWYVVNFARALEDLGVDALFDPSRVLICTDHEPVAVSAAAVERQLEVRAIVERYGIEKFFDVGRGGHGHIFPVEMGYVRPGMFVEGYDVHVNNFGAVGALAIPVVTEVTEVLACGSVWLRVPETVRVNLVGRLAPGVLIRDVAQRMIADLGPELVDYTVVEFGGPGLAGVSLAGRYTLCNTPIEIGAKSTVVEPDAATLAYLEPRVDGDLAPVASDADAAFKAVVDLDLGLAEPQVAVPPTPDCVVGVSEVSGRRIQHAFVGSCASSSLEDLRAAAAILAGRRIHPGVRFFVTPGTQEVMARATEEGLMGVFAAAGAVVTAPGCGPCAGGRIGGLGDGEASINTGTRNDFGRLGSQRAEIYLASPATVAASAVGGEITDPRELAPDGTGDVA